MAEFITSSRDKDSKNMQFHFSFALLLQLCCLEEDHRYHETHFFHCLETKDSFVSTNFSVVTSRVNQFIVSFV